MSDVLRTPNHRLPRTWHRHRSAPTNADVQNPASGEVVGDISNYYQGAPDIYVEEVLG
jgi:hypothetical protein